MKFSKLFKASVVAVPIALGIAPEKALGVYCYQYAHQVQAAGYSYVAGTVNYNPWSSSGGTSYTSHYGVYYFGNYEIKQGTYLWYINSIWVYDYSQGSVSMSDANQVPF